MATQEIRLGDLGEPIQKLIRCMKRDVNADELTLLSRITVREMARIYDMLGRGEIALFSFASGFLGSLFAQTVLARWREKDQ